MDMDMDMDNMDMDNMDMDTDMACTHGMHTRHAQKHMACA